MTEQQDTNNMSDNVPFDTTIDYEKHLWYIKYDYHDISNCDIPMIWKYIYEYNYLVSWVIALLFFILVSLCFKKSKTKYIIIWIIAILLWLIIYWIIDWRVMITCH